MKPIRWMLCVGLVTVAAMVALSGCGPKPVSAQSSAAPKSTVSGYYEKEQGLSGGKELHAVNLRDIKVERDKNNGDTIITLTFVDGSLQLGMDEAPTAGVPRYSTKWIEGVGRLALDIDGLSYWDYEVIPEEIADTPIQGVIKQSVENTERTRLYFNLRSGIVYQAHELDNKLILTLRALPVEETTKYYIQLNALDELSSGKLDEKQGFLPTLCSDGISTTLISEPFASADEANARLEQVKKDLLPGLPGKTATVVEVKGGELPRFDAQGALDVFSNTPVVRRDGKEQTADVLLTNGTILCWRPDGQAYVYASPFFLDNGGSESTSYVKLFLYDVAAGKADLLSDMEYSEILLARFSEDGRYVAYIDQDVHARVLYIKDTQAPVETVLTASEAGMGLDTATFCWGSGDAQHTIYAICGEEEMLQLMSYALKDEGEPEVETLVEEEFTVGSIGYYGGKVYYSQSSDEQDLTGVFVYDPGTRTTRRLSDGYSFEMNPRTGAMAILIEDAAATDKESYMLKLFNPADNSESVILDGKTLGDSIVWSNDGAALYFTVYYDNIATEERYTMALYRYDAGTRTNKELMDIAEGSLEASDRNTEVLFTYIFNQANQFVPVTYKLSN